ncbi:MAG: ribosomal protein [Rickettsiaceae bacterium]|jgi:large subunit ribosomal protein L35|nr:ribosomal protein [Rickettsiaceae bacterium]
MPKIKTKSAVKKRFKFTATGKVMHKPAGKKHGMVKRTKKFLRKQRPMALLCAADARIIKLFMRQK